MLAFHQTNFVQLLGQGKIRQSVECVHATTAGTAQAQAHLTVSVKVVQDSATPGGVKPCRYHFRFVLKKQIAPAIAPAIGTMLGISNENSHPRILDTIPV